MVIGVTLSCSCSYGTMTKRCPCRPTATKRRVTVSKYLSRENSKICSMIVRSNPLERARCLRYSVQIYILKSIVALWITAMLRRVYTCGSYSTGISPKLAMQRPPPPQDAGSPVRGDAV